MALLSPVSSISLAGLSSLGALTPLTPAGRLAPLAGDIGLISGASTIVQISAAGQLLTAVGDFTSQLARLTPALQASAETGDFGNLALAAQSFTNSFNELGSVLENLGGFFGGFAQQSPSAQLRSEFADIVSAEFAVGDNPLSRLADLGITLVPTASFPASSRLEIDFDQLAEVFETDAVGSATLLAAATAALTEAATRALGAAGGQPGSNTALVLAGLAGITAAGALSSGTLGEADARLRGFGDLFALAGITDASGESRARLFLALNQFALISTFTG